MAVSRYLIEVFIFVTWIAMNVGFTYVLCVCLCVCVREREREREREWETLQTFRFLLFSTSEID